MVSVPETYTAYLKQSDEISFSVKAFPNDAFKAKVSRLSGALDARLRSQRVEMDVFNNDKKLLPGMVTEVSIPLTAATQNFVVPNAAVLNSTLGTFVIQVEHDSAKWIPVSVGRQADGKSEIFGPLTESSQLVNAATEEIRDKEPLKGKAKLTNDTAASTTK